MIYIFNASKVGDSRTAIRFGQRLSSFRRGVETTTICWDSLHFYALHLLRYDIACLLSGSLENLVTKGHIDSYSAGENKDGLT